jgi:hypothetical protein
MNSDQDLLFAVDGDTIIVIKSAQNGCPTASTIRASVLGGNDFSAEL